MVNKKNSTNLFLIFFFLLIILVFSLAFYYFQLTKKNSLVSPSSISSTPTPIPEVRKQSELPIPTVEPTTGKKVLDIPIIFVVKSISNDEIILQKENGKENETARYYPKKYPVKVFKNLPPNELPATLNDLKIGQRIKVQNHLGEANYFYIID